MRCVALGGYHQHAFRMDCVTLFVDTNGFIQLRDLKDLKWRDLFPNVKQVRLMVARPVVEELGNFKTGTNQRRRDRARAALRLIDEASKSPARQLTLKDKPIVVTLEIAPRKLPDWQALSDLDPNNSDDRLVAAAVTFGENAAIFSHDSGPRLTAHDLGLAAHEPLEDWHLPPETSDAEKKVALLERQLKAAQSTKPHLQIQIEECESKGKITLFRPIVPALDNVAVNRLTNRYLVQYPRASLVGVNPILLMNFGNRITVDQVSDYNGEYERFAERVRKFFQTLHEQVPYYVAVPTVRVEITNIGNVSAVNYHVTMKTSGGISLVADVNDVRRMCPFPQAPAVPQPRSEFDVFRRSGLIPKLPKESHPTEMLWIERPKFAGSVGRYGCKDFQPQRVDVNEIAIWPDESALATGVLSIIVGANDVADLRESVEVTIEEQRSQWDSPFVLANMPEFLRADLKLVAGARA